MRIALFHTSLPEPRRKLGGVEVAVHRLANELARRDTDQVTVFSLTPRPAGANYLHHQLFCRSPWLGRNHLARWFFLPFLLNFIDWAGYDVLHLHGDDWFYVRRTCPTIRTMHGSSLREAQFATSSKRRLAGYLTYALERLSVRLATIPAAVGTETARIYGIERLVDNGVDIDLFHPGPKAAEPRVLYVGTWEGRKRGKWLFDLFVRQVLARIPEAKLCFVSDTHRAHPSVIGVQFPDDVTLAGLYREAWVFAYPSTYEGFGIPYVEALASGTAIVCSPNEGALHVLENGRFGVVATDDEFGQRVIDLLLDPGRREELEAGGLSRAGALSWKHVADRHREIYEDAASRWRRRGRP